MAPNELDTLDRAVQTARTWISTAARELGTDDQALAYRILRTWLHTLRDRLPVGAAADFAAQLPELLRGTFYEGWEPSNVPVKYGPDEYLLRFAHQGRLRVDDVPAAAAATARALDEHLSPGQLDAALDRLPAALRRVVGGQAPGAPGPSTTGPRHRSAQRVDKRIVDLESRISALSVAVDELQKVTSRAGAIGCVPGAAKRKSDPPWPK
jgi:uncharacterized protein (DUF2267 family)